MGEYIWRNMNADFFSWYGMYIWVMKSYMRTCMRKEQIEILCLSQKHSELQCKFYGH